MRLLLISTAVAPLGHGKAGGVGDTVPIIAYHLKQNGHHVEVLCPEGSKTSLPIQLIMKKGPCVMAAQKHNYTYRSNTVVKRFIKYIREHGNQYDIIINFSYDTDLYSETKYSNTPLLHYVSMSAISHMRGIINDTAKEFPNNIAFLTNAQRKTYTVNMKSTPILYEGIPVDDYIFSDTPKNYITWANRISEEKGLEDACELAQKTKTRLKIAGYMENKDYYNKTMEKYKGIDFEYCGFLNQKELQELLRSSKCLLMTSKWNEAFGKIILESLACGTPVISYKKAGPSEIIEDKKTGFLVKENCISNLIDASKNIHKIKRRYCRDYVEKRFSMTLFIQRIESWLNSHN